MSQEISSSLLTELVPVWLEAETVWANHKYGSVNPQLSALSGGLEVGGSAYEDFNKYYWKFTTFYSQAEGEQFILLKAAQNAGKFLNVGRALARVLIEATEGCSQAEADAHTYEWLGNSLVVPRAVHLDRRIVSEEWEQVYEPKLIAIAGSLAINDLEFARQQTSCLLREQAELFVDSMYTAGTAPMAGISSTDEHNQFGEWHV